MIDVSLDIVSLPLVQLAWGDKNLDVDLFSSALLKSSSFPGNHHQSNRMTQDLQLFLVVIIMPLQSV
jgi:hypothetical protein